jgi:microcystin-dependent protein
LRINGSAIVGQTGGSALQQLTVNELPTHIHEVRSIKVQSGGSHSHAVVDSGHNHGGKTGTAPVSYYNSGMGYSATVVNGWSVSTNVHEHTIRMGTTGISLTADGVHTHQLQGTTDSAGSGAPFPILQPYQTMNYMIYGG